MSRQAITVAVRVRPVISLETDNHTPENTKQVCWHVMRWYTSVRSGETAAFPERIDGCPLALRDRSDLRVTDQLACGTRVAFCCFVSSAMRLMGLGMHPLPGLRRVAATGSWNLTFRWYRGFRWLDVEPYTMLRITVASA